MFLASGLFHEIATLSMGVGFDIRTVLFFALQPLGLLVERLYLWMTGKRVSGTLGWLWTAIWVLGVGQLFSE